MKAFLQPDVPAPAKVLRLVRHHHGLPSGEGEAIPTSATMCRKDLARVWRAGARLNHLKARRRRIHLDDIPAGAFPVVLELGGGSQFLILREKLDECGTGSYLVQFPDARESLVRAERIREIYDGTCVFLRPCGSAEENPGETGRGPGSGSRWSWLARLRLRIALFPMKRGVVAAITCHVLTLVGVLGAVVSHGLAFPGENQDPLVPAVGVFMAAAVVAGILRLRREVLGGRLAAALVDGICLPFYGLAMVGLAGWMALPFFVVAAAVVGVLLLSDRLGQMPSRLREIRLHVVGGTFCAGAVAGAAAVSLGFLAPAAMVGCLVLGTCLIDFLIESDVLWQEVRLAMITR